MKRLLLFIACNGLALVAGVLIGINWERLRIEPRDLAPQPEAQAEAKPEAKAEPPTVARAVETPPPAETAAPAPVRRSARRAPAPTAEPAPAAPAPVAPEPDTGILHVDSDVPGARVFIDREYIGTTPVTAENIKPGTHKLNVSVVGYEGIADTIEVSPGPRDLLVRFKVVRLDSTLEVVHKHRIGSCKGRLVATPKGLRYETTNKEDAFNVGLLNLDTFEIDYMQKTLRIQPKNGRRFDFTDPEGNADRLFVFHSEVDKARERLKKGDPPAQ